MVTSRLTKKFLTTSIALIALTALHLHGMAGDISGKQLLNSRAKSVFIENKGQLIDQNNKPNPSVLYLLNTPGMNVQLRRGGFSYDLYSVTGSQGHKVTESQSSFSPFHQLTNSPSDSIVNCQLSTEAKRSSAEPIVNYHRIDFDLLNSNPGCDIITSGRSADYANYYTTGTPAEGVTNVRSYQTVTYKNIYPGIDLEFNTDAKPGVKYNFVVHPGGKLSSIRMKITDPEIELTSSGALKFLTTTGTMDETIPESHYRLAGLDKSVKVRFYKVSAGVYGFLPESPVPPNATLTIDPVPDRVWGTYYGGTNMDAANSCTLDVSGNSYIAGWTMSSDNIASAGAHQSLFAGTSDGFLAKFTPDGQRVWGTYYGGLLEDQVGCIAISGDQKIIVAGFTKSTENISTPGSFQPVFGGGNNDAFLAKFDSSGVRIWGTYYGGALDDLSIGCAVDQAGYIYFNGVTKSSNNISTTGCHQFLLGGGKDAFLAKFTPGGTRIWGTYYGGECDENAASGASCAIDGFSSVYICGTTCSLLNIATSGIYQPALSGGADGYIVQFDTSGVRNWGTYFGGPSDDIVNMIKVTTDHRIMFTGGTLSSTGIASPGAYQTIFGGGGLDAFLARFTQNGQRQWATYYGGTGADEGFGGVAGAGGYLYMNGRTSSMNAIAIADPFQSAYGGGYADAMLVKFDSLGNPIWGTYYGGAGNDFSFASLEASPMVHYLTGRTDSPDNMATAGVRQPFPGGNWDAFLAKFTECIPPVINIAGNTSVYQGSTEVYTTQPGMTGYTWTFSPGGTWVSGGTAIDNTITIQWNTLGVQWVKVNYTNADGCSATDPFQLDVAVLPSPCVNPSAAGTIGISQQGCGSFTPAPLTSLTLPTGQTGTLEYKWQQSTTSAVAGFTDIAGSNTQGYSPGLITQTTWYRRVARVDCMADWTGAAITEALEMTVTTPIIPTVTITATQLQVCAGTSVTFIANGLNGGGVPVYQWRVNAINVINANNAVFTYAPLNGDQVTCVFTSDLPCTANNPATSNAITITVTQPLPVSVSITVTSNPVCEGTQVTFSANPTNQGGTPIYQWKLNDADAGINSQFYTMTPANGDQVKCILTSSMSCVTGNPATSLPILMNVAPTPAVTFTPCFDTITSTNAKPIKLKGGLPYGGTYSGPGITAGYFYPNLAGTGTKIISYSYTNVANCTSSSTVRIINYQFSIFNCGSPLTDIRDNKVYPTVQIGTQCWMQTNLDFGITIDDLIHQTDNCIVEKYTPNSSLLTPNSFYQWDELMRYDPTPGLQGLCPPGWHVPDETEWNTLFNFYQGNARAGYPLQDPYLNGFKALQNGIYYLNSMWSFTDFATLFWSSTMADQTRAYAHGMNTIDQSVSVYAGLKANGFSVRCLKD